MPIADALRLLQQLHRRRNYGPVADPISALLEETRAHVGFILRPAGEQALANVLHVAELARQYEAGGGISFRGFIDELRNAALSTEAAEAPILEEGSDGVRLMTVHKAKGLEFPVVILADLRVRMRPERRQPLPGPVARLVCDSAPAAGLRTSCTITKRMRWRATKSKACGFALRRRHARAICWSCLPLATSPGGGWLSPLNAAVSATGLASHEARGPSARVQVERHTVLERPKDEVAGAMTVCPGRHDFAEGYSVVWWDPSALTLGLKAPMGVRRDDLIVKDVPRDVVADGRTRYDTWKLARITARERGSIPSIRAHTVRENVTYEGTEAQRERGPFEALPRKRFSGCELRASG
jgi:hypothetical protein